MKKIGRRLLENAASTLSLVVLSVMLIFAPSALGENTNAPKGDKVPSKQFESLQLQVDQLRTDLDNIPLKPPPAYPVLGDMYYNATEAICVYMAEGWVKIGGTGVCDECFETDGRFCDHGDGTVTDTTTTLMWAANIYTSNTTWENSATYCDTYTEGGYTDWRMPTAVELEELYYAGVRNYRHEYIKILSNDVWSSEIDSSNAAVISFFNGQWYWADQNTSNRIAVLPVRGGN